MHKFETLRRLVKGRIILPSDADYSKARLGFNRRIQSWPQAILLADSEEDISTTIKWARENGIRTTARGGGHSHEGAGQAGDLVVDLRNLSRVSADRKTKIVSVQGGANLGDVWSALSQCNLALPLASSPTVGIGGCVLGGGIDMFSRQYGLAIDNLESIEIIDASGTPIFADANNHRDLFWACRGGGGGNFGIVTRFNFRAHDAKDVTLFHLTWPKTRSLEVLHVWQEVFPDAPDELAGLVRLATDLPFIGSIGALSGSENELLRHIKPLMRIADTKAETRSMSHSEAIYYFAGDHRSTERPFSSKGKSRYSFGLLDDRVLRCFIEGVNSYTGPEEASFQFHSQGGAIARVPDEATAYPHRKATFRMQYYATWLEGPNGPALLNWIQDFHDMVGRFLPEGAFVNNLDYDLKNWEMAYYGPHAERLRKVKSIYDPDSFFQDFHGIPPRNDSNEPEKT